MNLNDLPMQQGVIHDLSNSDYHALPWLGSSGIKKLARSPRHFRAASDPGRPPEKASDAMRAGTLAHCAILEPEQLAARYAVKPAGHDGRTVAGKAWMAEHAHLEVVSADEFEAATRQAAAVRSLPEVGALLGVGRPEVSAFWVDEDTSIGCKCRPDWVAPAGDGVILIDVKTCQDASPLAFPKSVARFGYHLQAAWYVDGYAKASGKPVLGFVFAAVEADYPHAAAAYMLDDESLERGRAECRRLLALYRHCLVQDEWPGYPQTIQPIGLPAWA